MFYIWVCIWSSLFLYICLSLDLSSTYERKHVAFVFLILASLNMMSSNSIHLPPNHIIIPYGWIIHIYIYICNFLIHSSVLGHLGCFQNLAIVNSAVMNIGVQASLLYPVLCSLSWCPGAVSLDHMAVLSPVFWEIFILLSIMVLLICILTSSVYGFLFNHNLTNIFCCYYPWFWPF
jgi:hypothetical protein